MRHLISTPARPALLAGALAAVVAFPAAAGAAVVSQEGSTLVYTAVGGERNSLRVGSLGTSAIDLLEQGSTRLQSRTPACAPSGTAAQPDRSLRCGLSGITAIDVRLGDQDDSFSSAHPIATRVDAGSGDDAYSGISPTFGNLFGSPAGISQVSFQGGSGRDKAAYQQVVDPGGVIVTKDGFAADGRRGDRDNIHPDVEILHGSGQGDFLSGSDRDDTFLSSGGDDHLLGVGGDDLFLMGAVEDGPTRVIGGPDRDTVTYAQRDGRITVSADNDTSTDGEAGEGDRIEGVEVIEGGTRSDALFTPPTTELGYRLIGRDGNDLLSTAGGRDRLIGGRGEDTLVSGPDRDVIEAQDGGRDARIDCGSNGSDQLFRDFREVAHTGCEFVRLPGVGFVARTDITGRRQAETRSIAITKETTR